MADVATELTAMKRIATTLDALDDDTQNRVMVWLRSRYDTTRDDDHPLEIRAYPDPANT